MVLVVVAAAAVLTAWQVVWGRGQLRVSVTGLPADAPFRIEVRGPGGFEAILSEGSTLSVAPGEYRITAQAVRSGGLRYLTADETTSWRVDGDTTTQAKVDYAVAVSEKTAILDSEEPGLVKASSSELVFEDGTAAARQLRPGGFVVAAEGPLTPQGLVRKVISVRRNAGRVHAITAPASLREAMPKALLRVEPESAGATGNFDPVAFTETTGDEPDPDFEQETAIKLDTWSRSGKFGKLACGGGVPLIKFETYPPAISMAGTEAGWSPARGAWAKANLSVRQSPKLTLGSPIAAHCSFEKEFGPWDLGKAVAMLARVGPFKITPELTLHFGAEVKGEVGAKMEITQPLDFEAQSELGPHRKRLTTSGWPPKLSVKLLGAAAFKAKTKAAIRISVKASPVIEVVATKLFFEYNPWALEAEINIEEGVATLKRFSEYTVGVSLEPGPLSHLVEPREYSVSTNGEKLLVWKSKPGEVASASKAQQRINANKQVDCPADAERQCPTGNFDPDAAERLINSLGYAVTSSPPANAPGPLYAVAACACQGDGSVHQVFFFHGNRYVGFASDSNVRVVKQDGTTVTVEYQKFSDSDPQCCQSGPRARYDVHWTGSQLTSPAQQSADHSGPAVDLYSVCRFPGETRDKILTLHSIVQAGKNATVTATPAEQFCAPDLPNDSVIAPVAGQGSYSFAPGFTVELLDPENLPKPIHGGLADLQRELDEMRSGGGSGWTNFYARFDSSGRIQRLSQRYHP